MKRGIGAKWALLGIALLLCTAGNAWAQYGMVWTDVDGGGANLNSVADNTNDPLGVKAIMVAQHSEGYFTAAFNDVNNSTDAAIGEVVRVSLSTLRAALTAAHANADDFADSGTTVGATEVYDLTQNGVAVDAGQAIIRFSSSGDVITIETSSNGGGAWTTVTGTTSYDYSVFAATFGSNSEAATQSRQDKAKVSSRITSQMVTTRVMNVFSPKPKTAKVKVAQYNTTNAFASGYADNSGLSSGSDPYAGLGLWSMGAYASTEVTKKDAKSDGNIGIFMLGVDKLVLDDKMVLGLGAGYENSWSKIKSTSRQDDGEGFAISPYVAYRVTDDFLVKGVLNAAFNDYEAGSGGKDYEGVRTMADMSGEYTWIIDKWLIAAEAGYMYMNEDFDNGYTDVYLSEGRLSGKTGYEVISGLLPYLRATYFHDLSSSASPGYEKGSFEGALGLEYNSGSWTVSAEAFDNFNGDRETVGGSALVRYEF